MKNKLRTGQDSSKIIGKWEGKVLKQKIGFFFKIP